MSFINLYSSILYSHVQHDIHSHVSYTLARVIYTRSSYQPIHARQPLGGQHTEQEAKLGRRGVCGEHGAGRKLKDHVQRCGPFRVCQRPCSCAKCCSRWSHAHSVAGVVHNVAAVGDMRKGRWLLLRNCR
jgi:hypothetical protein